MGVAGGTHVKGVRDIFGRIAKNERLPQDIFVHLILVPLENKEELAAALHERLKGLQAA